METSIGKVVRRIEVLRDVKGLKRSDLAGTVEVTVDGVRVCVLAPIKVLKAKICNAVTLAQDDRNDVNHVRIMIECVREFTRDALAEASEGRISQRHVVDLLEELLAATSSAEAKKAASMWDLSFGSEVAVASGEGMAGDGLFACRSILPGVVLPTWLTSTRPGLTRSCSKTLFFSS